MGLFDKLERRLERGVHGAFAKAFRSEVQPVEVAAALRRAMDDRATNASKGKRPVVPNRFTVELSPTDFDRLTAYEDELSDELKASAAEHAETQRYTIGGPLTIDFTENDQLETGVFSVLPSIAHHTGYSSSYADQSPSREPAGPAGHAGPAAPAGAARPASQESDPDRQIYALPGAHHREPEPYAETDNAAYEDDFYDQRAEHDERADYGQPPYDDRQPPYEDDVYDQQPEPVLPPAPQHRSAQPLRPSPAAPKSYRQRPYIDLDGDRYPLAGAITVLGRDDDADIVLDDPGISRRHSEIRVTNDGPHLVCALSDLGSTNGTFVNGEPITSTHLTDGDRITVGRTSMIFHEGRRR